MTVFYKTNNFTMILKQIYVLRQFFKLNSPKKSYMVNRPKLWLNKTKRKTQNVYIRIYTNSNSIHSRPRRPPKLQWGGGFPVGYLEIGPWTKVSHQGVLSTVCGLGLSKHAFPKNNVIENAPLVSWTYPVIKIRWVQLR